MAGGEGRGGYRHIAACYIVYFAHGANHNGILREEQSAEYFYKTESHSED